jgi:hypothetical protein
MGWTLYVADAGIGPNTSHRQASAGKPSMVVNNLLELLMIRLQVLTDESQKLDLQY